MEWQFKEFTAVGVFVAHMRGMTIEELHRGLVWCIYALAGGGPDHCRWWDLYHLLTGAMHYAP